MKYILSILLLTLISCSSIVEDKELVVVSIEKPLSEEYKYKYTFHVRMSGNFVLLTNEKYEIGDKLKLIKENSDAGK